MVAPGEGTGPAPSILDRLIDAEAAGEGNLLGYDAARMIDTVRRDLEDLLNTRQSHQGMPEEFVELHDSVATYGLPDFTSVDASKTGQRKAIGKIIEAIIHKFEPRLREVEAVPYDDPNEKQSQRVSLHITARLNLDPSPEVGFDTVVELMSGHTSVRPEGRLRCTSRSTRITNANWSSSDSLARSSPGATRPPPAG